MVLLVGEHGGFWSAGAAACELEVRYVVGACYVVENFEDVFWYRVAITDEVVVFDEAFIVSSNQTYSP
jgi:hypothetical protein